jgi:hypothetical protein
VRQTASGFKLIQIAMSIPVSQMHATLMATMGNCLILPINPVTMNQKFNKKQIEEINGIITEISKAIQKNTTYEIAAREPNTLNALFDANKIEKTIKGFKCRPEYSSVIVNYFIKEKGMTLNKFNLNQQSAICLIS